LAIIDKLLISD